MTHWTVYVDPRPAFGDTRRGQATGLSLTEEHVNDDTFEELTLVVVAMAIASIHRHITLNHGPRNRPVTLVRFEMALENPMPRPASMQE